MHPEVTAPEVLAAAVPSRSFAVKNSFARLDLAPAGSDYRRVFRPGLLSDLEAARQAGFQVLGALRIWARPALAP